MLIVLAVLVAGCAPAAAHPAAISSPPPAPSAPADAMRPLHLVALGDSVPAGTACACRPYPDLVGDALRSTGRAVTVDNLAAPGQVTAGVLAELAQPGPTSDAVAGADVVLVQIGANDLLKARDTWKQGSCGGDDGLECYGPPLQQLSEQLHAVLARIQALRAGRPTAVRVLDYWNVFEDGAVAQATFGADYRAAADAVTRQANARICAAAAASQATCVDLYAPFKGAEGTKDPTALLAGDGDHPSAAGHRLIAELVAAAGWAPVLGASAP